VDGGSPSGVSSRPRVDAAEVQRVLHASGLRARHALSQNFLADVDVLERILAEAAPSPGRHILEIGPGLGILTGALLEARASVTAVELDPGLAAQLRERFSAALERDAGATDARGSLRLIEGDALDQDLVHLLQAPYDVVANLPYHITSPILHALLGEPPPPQRMVVMVQREVAERIAARPGSMSYLSVFVQYHAAARVAFTVPRDAFEPAPDVESAVIVLEPYGPGSPGADARGRLAPGEEDDLWRLVQAGFRERRKMVRNVLSRQLPIDASRVQAALDTAGIDPERRPQTLSVDDWLALHRALGPVGPDRRGRASKRSEPSGRREAAEE
jgi:16S rRNA (adenine1518-N6/adenine1519-N6)-dimethyltransferase